MNKLFLILSLFLVSQFSFAQSFVGYREGNVIDFNKSYISSKSMKGKKLKDKNMDRLKKTTTIFVLPGTYSVEEYEKVISKAWTLTPYRIIPHSRFKIQYYTNEKTSIMKLGVTILKENGSSIPIIPGVSFNLKSSIPYPVLQLDMYDPKIKEQLTKASKLKADKRSSKQFELYNKYNQHFASSLLNLNEEYLEALRERGKKDLKFAMNATKVAKTIIRDMYSKPIIDNFTLGMLKDQLEFMNYHLTKGDMNTSSNMGVDNDNISMLAQDTLFIPEYVGVNKDNIDKKEFIDELFEDYDFNYKVVSKEELDNRYRANQKTIYLTYVSSIANEKLIQIINSKTSETIYFMQAQSHVLSKSEVKNKYINALNKEINKRIK